MSEAQVAHEVHLHGGPMDGRCFSKTGRHQYLFFEYPYDSGGYAHADVASAKPAHARYAMTNATALRLDYRLDGYGPPVA